MCTIPSESNTSSHNWPAHAHEVLVTGSTLLPRAPPHPSNCVLHITTRAALRGLAVYRVDAAFATWELLRTIHLQEAPVCVLLHPSMHYVCAVMSGGSAEVVHLHTGRTRGVFSVNAQSPHLGEQFKCAAYDTTGVLFAAAMSSGRATPAGSAASATANEQQHADDVWRSSAGKQQMNTGQQQHERATGNKNNHVSVVIHDDKGPTKQNTGTVGVFCSESGDMLSHVTTTLPAISSIAFLPLASALVCCCVSGCLVIVKLGDALGIRARRVAHGRLQDGGSIYDYWLEHPIDMQLSKQKRKHASEAVQNVSVRRLQAVIRRAVDPIGPCVHLARMLMPYITRNAIRRILTPRLVLRAAVRMTLVRTRLSQWRDAVLSIQACVRRLVSHRAAEDMILEPERLAAHALIVRGDPDGCGVWDMCDRAVATTLIPALVRACMWDAFSRQTGIILISRMVEICGVRLVISHLEHALESMYMCISCRAHGRRKLESWEVEQIRAVAEDVGVMLFILQQHALEVQEEYRTFLPPDVGTGVWIGEAAWMYALRESRVSGDATGHGSRQSRLDNRDANVGADGRPALRHGDGEGVGADADVAYPDFVYRAFSHELAVHEELQISASTRHSVYSCAAKLSRMDHKIQVCMDVARATVSRLTTEARLLLQQSPSVQGYTISAMGGDKKDEALRWLEEREGKWLAQCLWLRMSAKGVIPVKGARIVTMRQVCQFRLFSHACGALCAESREHACEQQIASVPYLKKMYYTHACLDAHQVVGSFIHVSHVHMFFLAGKPIVFIDACIYEHPSPQCEVSNMVCMIHNP